jgi:pimeloyl-ACP methyl ester carboxylesterase
LVLVGHSLGGVFVRRVAQRVPERVAGLVLVDPSHPDQTDRLPAEVVDGFRGFVRMMEWTPWLARVGIMRATNLLAAPAATLPPADYAAARRFGADVTHLRASGAELATWDRTMAQVRAGTMRGDLPLIVLTARRNEEMPQMIAPWTALHADLAGRSTRGEHRLVAEADHLSLVLHPEHARHVAQAIRDVLARSQDGR